MKSFKTLLIVSILCSFWLQAETMRADTPTQIALSNQQKSYLANKKHINICIDPNWMPFEKIEDGKYIGISSLYMKLIESKIKTPFVLVPTQDLSQSLRYMRERKCDVISLVMPTKSRENFMDFTLPYLSAPLVLATKSDKVFIPNFSKLDNKTIGIGREHASFDILKQRYPKINFVAVENPKDGLNKVLTGEIFGYADILTAITYEIHTNFSQKLRVVGKFDEQMILSIGVRNDEPILLDILNQAINSIDMITRDNIINHWLLAQYDEEYDSYKFLYPLIAFILIVLFLLVRQFILKKYNQKLKNQVSSKVEELREKDELLLQKYRMAAMGEMLSMIAHQWRQPLGAISSAIMSVDVKLARGKFDLAQEQDRKEFLEFLENKHASINEYVNYLSATTDDFRNFFNPNRDKELIEVSKPIIDALHILHKHLESKNIDVIVDFESEDSSCLMYQNEIMQVIISIIRNAQEHFETVEIEEPTITILTYREDGYDVITICDNGGGIPEEIIENIFEPYFSTKKEQNGSGLGLYMSKIMIEDHHNGILQVSNKDDGACFEIKFSEQQEVTQEDEN